MKKVLSMLVAGMLCTSLSAQVLNEGFEGEQFAPEGWTTLANHNYPSFSSWQRVIGTGGGEGGNNIYAHSGSACAYTNPMAGADNWLITPQLCPEAGEKLIFWARLNDYANGAELQVLLSTTGSNPEDFKVVLGALSTSSKAGDPRLLKEWNSYQVPMEDFVGQRIFIAFRQYDQYSASKMYLDDISGVTIASSATCPAPNGLAVSEIGAGSATISWNGEAAEYQYCYVPAGAGAYWERAVKTTDKSVTIAGLVENTAYDFYVRAYCSDAEQSLAPKVSFSTTCQPAAIPWYETFTGDPVSSGYNVVSPECWIVASESNNVAVVISKDYSDEDSEDPAPIAGTEHLYIVGGGPLSEQVFALPAFNAPLNTLEVAFDYYHSFPTADYGTLELGYMTNPTNAKTFVSIKTLAIAGSYTHVVQPLESLSADAQFIAFRYAGGTSELGNVHMDNFVVAPIGQSDDVIPQGVGNVQRDNVPCTKVIRDGQLVIEYNGIRYNAQGSIVP